MAKRIFVWVAHPRAGAFCEALGKAYADGAQAAGAELRLMTLSTMTFALDFEGYSGRRVPLEPDLLAWQEAIAWSEHVVIVHPYWWGAMPAKAKAVLDRALVPGFGFKYHATGLLWDKLLTGRTADVIITSDTPPLFDTLAYGMPGRRVIRNQVLGFCGIKLKRRVQIGPIKTASEKKRAAWLARASEMGRRAAG